MTIYLLNKEVDLDKGELLLSLPFADASDLEQLELASGSWGIENGALVGRSRGNGGGICYTKESFPGDILIDFYGTMLSPCNNDLNFVLKAEGWDYERNDAARGFIGGLNGWYDKKAGFEKYPLCDTLFLAVDGQLLVEMRDPAPEEFAGFGRIGLGTYCSQIRFRDLKILRPSWRSVSQSYQANF